uniref:Uncharacterized protein n=1 Tax=viral metagenome TaxID=1070528 RepID=A0A6C0ANC2_9ZZZZ
MILAPYFWNTSDPNWFKLGIFLSAGGREQWQLDSKDKDKQILKMLKENGFPVLGLKRQTDMVIASIDPGVNLSEFYTWDEINPKTSQEDVWRIFTIPAALWTCPVFKEQFWKSSGLPPMISSALELSI